MKRRTQITVIGDSTEIKKNNEIAYEVGKYIAQQGWVMINGGRGGVMAAAARGAIESGGVVVSIIPDADINNAHPYSTITIPTGIGFARNSINVLAGDVLVGIGGGCGTLSEIGYAWCYQKPLIVAEWSFGWSAELADKKLDNKAHGSFIGAKDMDDLKQKLKQAVDQLHY